MSGWGILEYVLAVLGVSALIAWHELGHYMAARLLGMRVLKYSVGFGPKLWSFERGGIEYQIAAIPFGGFVQVFGMAGIEEGAYSEPDSYQMKPRWARFLVLFAGPFFNYILAAALFFGLLMVWPGGNVRVHQVFPDRPAAQAGLLAGDEIVDVDGQKLSSIDHFTGHLDKGTELTLNIVRDPLENKRYALGLELLKLVEANKHGGPGAAIDAEAEAMWAQYNRQGFKARLGAQPNTATQEDIAMRARRIRLLTDELRAVEALLRNEKRTPQTLKLRVKPVRPNALTKYAIGFVPGFEDDPTRKPSFGKAVEHSIAMCWFKSVEQAYGLASIFTSMFTDEKSNVELSGPPGIVKALAKKVRENKKHFIYILGLLSVTLAVFNIIPIPALDGFKMMWLVVEMILRGEVLPRVQMWLNVLGFLLLMGTLFIVSAKDMFG